MSRLENDLRMLNRRSAVVFLVFFLSYGWFIQDPNPLVHAGWFDWNINARLGLTFALVEEGRLTIDDYHHEPATETRDEAFYDGHYYSDKPIGASLLGAVLYVPLHALYRAGIIHNQPARNYLVRYVLTLWTVALPSAFAASLTFTMCLFVSQSVRRAVLATWAIFFGTLCFPYSTIYYGHQLSGSLLTIAFFLLFRGRHLQRALTGAEVCVCAFSLGYAVLSDFLALVMALPLAAYTVRHILRSATSIDRFRHLILALVCGGTPAVFLMAYNTACFGGPFHLGYSHVVDEAFQVMNTSFFGMALPKAEVLGWLLTHPDRGLLVQSPVLLLSAAGLVVMMRDPRWRLEGVFVATTACALLLVNSAYYMWWGGSACGPRLVICALPLLALPLAVLGSHWRSALILLTLASCLQMLIFTATNPRMGWDPYGYGCIPAFTSRLPELLAGQQALNLGTLLHLHGLWSLFPLAALQFAGLAHLLNSQPDPVESRLT